MPGEIANAVLFLASAESSFIQASEIVIDGGSTNAPLGARNLCEQASGPVKTGSSERAITTVALPSLEPFSHGLHSRSHHYLVHSHICRLADRKRDGICNALGRHSNR